VTLSTFDALARVPAELREKYDVVHIRLVALVVKGGDPSVLIGNLVSMLSKLCKSFLGDCFMILFDFSAHVLKMVLWRMKEAMEIIKRFDWISLAFKMTRKVILERSFSRGRRRSSSRSAAPIVDLLKSQVLLGFVS